ncbi:hypothetical protein TTRE_0000054201 [Trichuris trichiura]|uniref:Uncharacterized protein n=1 Tax=Trichuris trichiura TaxID=36087 RepID=A0A077YXV5_TRITR|nr:hypothetical protein TTRE_0000054201 [Trichuris trichiura]
MCILGYCVAMICISIGVVLSQPLRLYEPFKPENSTTPVKCAVVFWHLHFYAVGEPLLALSTFMIAFGNFLIIHGKTFQFHLGAHYVRSCFIIQAGVVLVNLTLNLTQIFLRSNVPINTRCFQKEVVDYKYNVVVFTGLALCGYLTVLTEVVTFLLLRLNKSNYTAIRLLQIRREVAVMKQTIVLVIFVFIAQTVPNTYKFIDNLGYHSVFWDRFVSVSSIAAYSFFALHTIVKTLWNRNRVEVQHDSGFLNKMQPEIVHAVSSSSLKVYEKIFIVKQTGTSVEAYHRWTSHQVLDPRLEEAVVEGMASEPEEALVY